jgi:hypothetical protein
MMMIMMKKKKKKKQWKGRLKTVNIQKAVTSLSFV